MITIYLIGASILYQTDENGDKHPINCHRLVQVSKHNVSKSSTYIYNFSRTFTRAERAKSIIVKECIACLYCLSSNRFVLDGATKDITLYIDSRGKDKW